MLLTWLELHGKSVSTGDEVNKKEKEKSKKKREKKKKEQYGGTLKWPNRQYNSQMSQTIQNWKNNRNTISRANWGMW